MENKIEIYKTADNQTEIKVHFDTDTVWLNQKQMAELFDKDTDTIGLHLKNIYSESELNELSTTEFFSVFQQEGKRSVQRRIKFYNLDAMIPVGYRMKLPERYPNFELNVFQIMPNHIHAIMSLTNPATAATVGATLAVAPDGDMVTHNWKRGCSKLETRLPMMRILRTILGQGMEISGQEMA